VKKFDTPLEHATTPSLEALQAYSLGWAMKGAYDDAAAVPLFQRAIGLDPKFAMSYAALGQCYLNLGQDRLATENTRKAYELREQVSEREQYYIEAHYYDIVTGDLERARQVYEPWQRTYPRDFIPPRSMGFDDAQLGQFDKALVEELNSLRLKPDGDHMPWWQAFISTWVARGKRGQLLTRPSNKARPFRAACLSL